MYKVGKDEEDALARDSPIARLTGSQSSLDMFMSLEVSDYRLNA